jgi:hypothetical protein
MMMKAFGRVKGAKSTEVSGTHWNRKEITFERLRAGFGAIKGILL